MLWCDRCYGVINMSTNVVCLVGLWPLLEGGTVPSSCSIVPFNLKDITPLVPALNQVSHLSSPSQPSSTLTHPDLPELQLNKYQYWPDKLEHDNEGQWTDDVCTIIFSVLVPLAANSLYCIFFFFVSVVILWILLWRIPSESV